MVKKYWWLGAFLLPLHAAAQVQTLKDAAQQAILNNPEVLARFHALEAARQERSAAAGGYLPRLDLNARKGREKRDDPILRKTFTQHDTSLTLTQMLYDGFATYNEVARLDHVQKIRLHELHDISETTALDVARTYLDVLRYRKLVALAEENYVRHRTVFEQIQRKAQAGVGRRVDLEQAAGRLALAEANLLTETANLHDVSARFQRLVGSFPAKELQEPAGIDAKIPADVRTALASAIARHPSMLAAIENVRASDKASSVRNSSYQPRIDLRLSSDRGNNSNGIVGYHKDSAAEVVMSWNLFNGLSDRARSKQFAQQANVARDQRDKACRDLRQTLMIAFNDVRKLTEQLTYLDQHQLSIEKARDAYRKQFDIGQRTLLDLLDTENELFQAHRAYANAHYDLMTAQARTQAGIGTLVSTLGLSRADGNGLPDLETKLAADEAAHQCEPEEAKLYTVDKAALNARAQELMKESVAEAPAQTPQPAATRTVAQALKNWSAAWTSRDVNAYLDAYSPQFAPADGKSRSAWAASRRKTIEQASDIHLDISDVQVVDRDVKHAATTFRQSYRSASYQDVVTKTLEWENVDGRWLILKETVTPAAAAR